VGAVQNVCATCHVFQAQLFQASPHQAAFAAASLPGCVTCHSNHRVAHPSDALLGTGPQSVCTNCHTSGDAGYQAADQMQQQLSRLDAAAKSSDEILARAESDGMEVSEARLEQDQARDSLTKARVTIHSFNPARVEQDIQAGVKITDQTHQAGVAALQERDYRRKGLAWSVLAIVMVLIGLRLYTRRIERGGKI
jgi:predicted CXXCH cytochrome family protein